MYSCLRYDPTTLFSLFYVADLALTAQTLKDQFPALYSKFAKYGTNITIDRDNGNCAGRGFNTQIANPIVNGAPVTSSSFFRH